MATTARKSAKRASNKQFDDAQLTNRYEDMLLIRRCAEAKAKPKAKRKPTKRKPKNQRLEESQAKQNVSENFIPKEVAEVNTLPLRPTNQFTLFDGARFRRRYYQFCIWDSS